MNCRSLKTAKNLKLNIPKRPENVTHCFILNGKELPIHYSTTADIFRDVFCDVYLRAFYIFLHFRRGHIVIETPIGMSERQQWEHTIKVTRNSIPKADDPLIQLFEYLARHKW